MTEFRTETDSLGPKQLPREAVWGEHVVTYSLCAPVEVTAAVAPTAVQALPSGTTERLRGRRDAHEGRLVTDDEYAQKRDELLRQL